MKLDVVFFLQKIKGDISALERQLATSKKQLEEETLSRVDLQNRLQTMKEELTFKSQMHEQVQYL